jgi:cytochrome P450
LPAGSVVYVPIQVVHRHPALWSEPDVFDPDRFAPEAVRARHRFAYLPFGAGPRICIGSQFATMEAVAILAVLAKALRLELFEPVPPPRMRVTLRPTKPLRMRVVTAERGGR